MKVRCNKVTAWCRIEKCPHAKPHERQWYEHTTSSLEAVKWAWCTQWDWCDWRHCKCRCVKEED